MQASKHYSSTHSPALPRPHKFDLGCIALLAASLCMPTAWAGDKDIHAQTPPVYKVQLPLVVGWFNGKAVGYIQTEASDQGVATMSGVNYVPRLANAANTLAVDDIYVVTNFAQSNVIASAPKPTGPGNLDQAYSPLWQVTTVTWKAGVTPVTLTSEAAVTAAVTAGKVSLAKTTIIVNCPVIVTEAGGLLPNAKIDQGHD